MILVTWQALADKLPYSDLARHDRSQTRAEQQRDSELLWRWGGSRCRWVAVRNHLPTCDEILAVHAFDSPHNHWVPLGARLVSFSGLLLGEDEQVAGARAICRAFNIPTAFSAQSALVSVQLAQVFPSWEC